MMFGYGSGWPFWEVGLMWVAMIAFWGLIIWAVYALVAAATRKPDGGQPGGTAARILDERLAKGEIDATEYQHLRDLMGASHTGGPTPAGSGR